MSDPSVNAPAVMLLVPDLTDISTLKRAHAFLTHGFKLTVYGFRRNRYNSKYKPNWPHVELGRTADRRYAHRISALVRALPILIARRRALASTQLFYARNIDQMVLALVVRRVLSPRAIVVYEVLDIQPALTRRGLSGVLLRALERLCLRQAQLLVVSSPGFIHGYFQPVQRYSKEWFLLENKLDPLSLPSQLAMPNRIKAANQRWVVGYFGLIRGEAMFALITRLAKQLSDHVLFRFGGIITTVDRRRFFEALSQHENIVYDGEYISPRDLTKIYTEVDFAWAIDLEHVETNSRWLLPCRFYEAGLMGVPCLAAHGFEVGHMIERLDVGWTFTAPFEESLTAFFRSVTPAEYARKQQRLAALPRSTFTAGEDIDALCDLLKAKAGRPIPTLQPLVSDASNSC